MMMKTQWIREVMLLPEGAILKLSKAEGARLRVGEGLLWVTEEGVPEDQFLKAGQSYAVQHQGTVIVSAECDSKLSLLLG
jgi:Protein of unknown function (DUF2917)